VTAKKAEPAKRGRRAKLPEEKLVPFSIRMPRTTFDRLRGLAHLLDTSISDACTHCIRERMSRLTLEQQRAIEDLGEMRQQVLAGGGAQ
jgi:hypothetical protein